LNLWQHCRHVSTTDAGKIVHVEQASCHGSNPALLQFWMYVVVVAVVVVVVAVLAEVIVGVAIVVVPAI
jgi:hypothetical protein